MPAATPGPPSRQTPLASPRLEAELDPDVARRAQHAPPDTARSTCAWPARASAHRATAARPAGQAPAPAPDISQARRPASGPSDRAHVALVRALRQVAVAAQRFGRRAARSASEHAGAAELVADAVAARAALEHAETRR